jgi:hypothetical protein
MKLIHQAHDKLFKIAMADIRVARDFFQHHLPAHILALINTVFPLQKTILSKILMVYYLLFILWSFILGKSPGM